MTPSPRTAPTTSTTLRFRTAGVRVELTGLDGELLALLGDAGSGMLSDGEDSDGPAPLRLAVTIDAGGRRRLHGAVLDDEPRVAAASLLSAVDRVALAATHCLTIHAAAVAGPTGAAVIPGVSGSGKSTLAGASMQAGLRLVSDEAACIDPEDLRLRPHARPLGLSADSRSLLGLASGAAGPDEVAVAPALLGGCVPGHARVGIALVVVAERRPGALPRLVPATSADGVAALLGACLNTGATGAWRAEDAWRLVARMMGRLPVARLRYDRPQDGADLLLDRLTRPASTPAP